MAAKNGLRAEIEIDADPDIVWSVLADFGAYPEWNQAVNRALADRAAAMKTSVV